ncbi:MAG: hypothetical protein A2664_03815 [Candidatus Taylorbacteria bacterium RIFCSPHIGHO2_01_FULL_46_22b]|uniref:Transcriptional repressor n=1 Tax=Candidatus Taylorbacteria bacterium RIFCSPHIGHO2_01_FULL_46_22b TaxID=1802301 RepID=A0A1G2M1M2_9BACT|nr:MAG: hypothetical protein A2664_03815 [Candidatus Taylorbacteria bacterium RIFCSPHIGHO2_01_FULL_46_22b]
MKRKDENACVKLLRDKKFKATQGRTLLLSVLKEAGRPLSIIQLLKLVKGKLDQATLYRALEAFTHTGLVRRVDLGHAHTHYELVESDWHHHHVICRECGKIEDIADCHVQNLERTLARHTKFFKEINSHSLEYFGRCKQCVTK